MTRRAAGLAGLILLAACNRNRAELTPDADAETRTATAAKTLADIAAADEASRRPLPAAARPRPIVREEAPPPDPAENVPVDIIPTNEAAAPAQ